ncbi:glycoside hydrolase family 2 TIM barrel-domain containing protein [Chitinophaga japonensis]|nr:glycoside hydrolase family 2 TIM barrel-domain containing protein [Chitinophaga japonensis]
MALVFCFFTQCNTSPAPADSRKVFIRKEGKQYTLYREGQPFVIRGAAGYTHPGKLRAIGGNTIRTWDTTNIGAILDEAQRHHLAVIVGLPMPGSDYTGYFYKDTARVAAQYRAFSRTVQQYKDHPALLMWCLGNEPGFSFKWRYRPFIKAFNDLLDMIHATDPDHPVTTTMINFSIWEALCIKWKVHDLDLVSFNIFGQLPGLQRKLDKYAWLWNGPFLVSEWGTYGPWEVSRTAWGAPVENTGTKKAEQYQQLYTQLPARNPRFLGALVFYWGQKQELTPTWFSLLDEKGGMTAAAGVMQELWTGHPPAHAAPPLKYMLLDGRGAMDNIIFPANTAQTAEILMENAPADSLALHWEIWQEDWFSELGKQQPVKVQDTLITGSSQWTFTAPRQEGPYRVYVKVTDRQGSFSTANTPFYVVEQE